MAHADDLHVSLANFEGALGVGCCCLDNENTVATFCSLPSYCFNSHQISMPTLTVTLKIASLSSQLPTLSTLLLHGNKMQQITSEIFASVARYSV